MDKAFNVLNVAEKKIIGTLMTGKPSDKASIAALMTIFVMVAGTLFYWNAPLNWANWLYITRADFFQSGQVWRAFTAIFVHADIEHLLSNMLLLWVFSFFIFGYFGFKVFPVLSLFMAALVNVLTVWTYEPSIHLIGASGLVYFLGGLWLTLYAQIQRQYSWGQRLLRVVGIALMIFLPSTFVASTSYRAHAIGFLMGVFVGILYFYKNKEKIRLHEVYREYPIEEIEHEDVNFSP